MDRIRGRLARREGIDPLDDRELFEGNTTSEGVTEGSFLVSDPEDAVDEPCLPAT